MWKTIVRLGHWMRIAIGLWVGFTIAAEVKAWKHPDQHAVYPVFAAGARRWLSDEPLYVHGFYYSPAFAAAMAPLARLPDRVGGVIWGTLNLAVVFAALMVFCREVVQRVRPEIRQGPFLALCLAATIHGCWSGQANALILALVLLAAVAALRGHSGSAETDKADGTRSVPASVGHWWTAALLLAAAAHIKIWAVVVVALLALRWFRPLIPRFLAAFVLVGLLPLAAKTPAQVLTAYQQWLACLAERMAGGERWPGYRDAWTIWENLAPPVNRHVFSAMSLAAGLLAAAWCYRQSTGVGWVKQTAFLVGLRSRLDRFAQAHHIQRDLGLPYSLDARFVLSVTAAWACWQLLFGPGAERLTYGIIAPAVSWAVCESILSKRHRALALAAWLLTGVLGTGEIESRLQTVLPIAQVAMPLGPVLLAAWLMAHTAQASSCAVGPANDRVGGRPTARVPRVAA